MNIITDGAAVDRILRGPNGPVLQYAARLGQLVQDGARRQVGKDTRTAENSIVKRFARDSQNNPTVLVGVFSGLATKYVRPHHEGTRPHVIHARPGSVLSFYWPKAGRIVFFPRVNHPGTRPNRFLVDPLKELRR